MALKTIGTLLTTSLQGLQYSPDPGALSNADLASIAQAIMYDQGAPGNALNTIYPAALARGGQLFIPDRGVLRLLPGDWVAFDASGFPFLIPTRSLPKTLTATGNTHTNLVLDNMSVNVRSIGWQVGTELVATTNADLPAGCQIAAISADGKTITLSAAATGTNVGGTITAGAWTHS